MPSMIEHVNHLSREIGPRPAGTEEEHQSALYIEEQFGRSIGLPVSVDEFNGATGSALTRVVCSSLCILGALLFMITSVLYIPGLVLILIGVGLFVADFLDKPVLSRVLTKGVSQNVVAKYQPEPATVNVRGRKRKVIIVTRYDSGKVRQELNFPFLPVLGKLNKASAIALPFLLVWMLIRFLFIPAPVGGVAIFLNVVTIIAIVLALLPIVLFALSQTAAYTDGANGSASGVAVMLDVAQRVMDSSLMVPQYMDDDDEEPVIHGEDAALEEGLIPEGAEVSYEDGAVTALDDSAAAFGAMATQTFEPVSESDDPEGSSPITPVIEEQPLVDTSALDSATEEAAATMDTANAADAAAAAAGVVETAAAAVTVGVVEGLVEAAAPAIPAAEVPVEIPAPAPVSEPEPVAESNSYANFNNVPDWFRAAQQKAKKKEAPAPVQRSQYADMQAVASTQPASDYQLEEETSFENQVASDAGQAAVPEPLTAEETINAAAQQQVNAEASALPVETVAPEVPQAQFDSASPDAFVGEATPVAVDAAPMAPVMPAAPVAPTDWATAEISPVAETPAAPEPPVMPAASAAPVPPVPPAAPAAPAPVADRVMVSAQDDDLAMAAVPTVPEIAVAPIKPVVLPEVAASQLTPIDQLQQQRAPLAEASNASDSQSAAKGLLNMLPNISMSMARLKVDEKNEPKAPVLDLPSFSGIIPKVEEATDDAAPNCGNPGATGSFAPVTEALIAEHQEHEEDLYVEDADDAVYEENYTETGTYAGPDYMEMPKSRFSGLFGKFFKRKKTESVQQQASTHQWLELDEDFDPRSVGEARGDWESFQEDSDWNNQRSSEDGAYFEDGYSDQAAPSDDYYDDGYYGEDDRAEDARQRNWEGGAFSGMKDKLAGAASGVAGAAAGAVGSVKDRVPFGKAEASTDSTSRRSSRRSSGEATGERPARSRRAHASEFVGIDLPLRESPVDYEEDVQAIEQFENPAIQTEIWFVALGSDLDGNAGMKAFMQQNAGEMRGSVIIELDSLGAGTLSYINEEGSLKPVKSSSRMKRYIRKVTQTLGFSIPTVALDWSDSASSYANSHGAQALHLAGLDVNKQAYFGQVDDVVENVDEDCMNRASDCVMEIIRNV